MTARPRLVDWVSTTRDAPWRRPTLVQASEETTAMDIMILPEQAAQVMEGFGFSFNAMGWRALELIDEHDREAVMHELFSPGQGANFRICRTPLGANDFSSDWFSYDEVDGDLSLAHFSIEPDRADVLPFIKSALAHQPDLRLWASPWSPPTWMKTNRHYAGALAFPGAVDNGLRPDQVGVEGSDMFRVEERYLRAYARYFRLYLEAYADEGVRIEMVMPQNEFNSPQPFPSCTWTPAGLARFITVLAEDVEPLGVSIFLGTLERDDPGLIEAVMGEPGAAEHIRGLGVQWAAKRAVPVLRHLYPTIPIFQTEQECGDGANDWRHARHMWALLRQFIGSGASAYMYWNPALLAGGVSRWGWPQNSLIVVDPETREWRWTHEYHVLKHLSHFLEVGARVIETFSLNGHDDVLAFANPGGQVVVAIHNPLPESRVVHIVVDGQHFAPQMDGDSFSTFVFA